MAKFRIKEVRQARTDSYGNKKSLYFPQRTNLLGIWRNIKPSEMNDPQYKGNAIQFREIMNAVNFVGQYRAKKGFVSKPKKMASASDKVVYHYKF